MKSKHRLRVNAPVDTIYQAGLLPSKWLTFHKDYRDLEAVSGDWPEEGSSLVIRFHALGPWVISVKQTALEHVRGQRLKIYQEALGGLYIDTIEVLFEAADASVLLTVIENQTSRMLLARPLVALIWPLSYLDMRRALKRLKALVEGPTAVP